MEMIERLQRMRKDNRNVVEDNYTIMFDRNNDYYILSYPTKTIDLNGKTYIVDRVDDLPARFYTNDYLNADGSIDYAGLWADMQTEMDGGIDGDEEYVVVVNEDGDEELEWLNK